MAMTLNQLCAEATERGYEVYVRKNALSIARASAPHVNRLFSLNLSFSLDQEHAPDYALLQAYYWMRGYHLAYGDDGKIALQRGMLHPAFDQAVWVEQLVDYGSDADWDISKLHDVLLQRVTEYEQAEKEHAL